MSSKEIKAKEELELRLKSEREKQ